MYLQYAKLLLHRYLLIDKNIGHPDKDFSLPVFVVKKFV